MNQKELHKTPEPEPDPNPNSAAMPDASNPVAEALLHNSYPVDYPLSSDGKYLSRDRHFPSSNLASNDFLERRNGLPNHSLGHPLTLNSANANLDYSHSQLLHADTTYHSNSQLVLSPPSSVDGTSTLPTNQVSSSFGYSSVPKLASNNVTNDNHYSSASNFYTPSPWNGSILSDFNTSRTRAPSLQQHMSTPPQSYGTSVNMPDQYQQSRDLAMDPYNLTRSSISNHDPIWARARPGLSPIFQPGPYSSHFSPMVQGGTNRPDGPPFEETKVLHNLVTSRSQPLDVEIQACIPKGFFHVEGKWTCYRRNYFTITCAFNFKGIVPEGQVFLQRQSHSHLEHVRDYAVSITARTAAGNNQDSEIRGLVQHTPKRDKATESVPGRHLVCPASPPNPTLANGISQGNLYQSNQHYPHSLIGNFESLNYQAQRSVPPSWSFERIQFQKATANNGKRRAQQQYFQVVVQLEVNVGRRGEPDKWVTIATKQSHPMVVRGRSPGHYKDNRRDSQSSMDRDRGAGSVRDHANASYHGANVTGVLPHMNWTSAYQRHSHQYGNSYGQFTTGPARSSTSPESSTTLTESPIETEFNARTLITGETPNDCGYEHAILDPVSDTGITGAGSQIAKPAIEHDNPEEGSDNVFISSTSQTQYAPPTFDYTAVTGLQRLCASS